jgi:hypothetical protein
MRTDPPTMIKINNHIYLFSNISIVELLDERDANGRWGVKVHLKRGNILKVLHWLTPEDAVMLREKLEKFTEY